ncbi:MAG: hypothetical protein DRO39_08070 [Thermoprotei archaeon]|nr:MAG: hypothetical protein DRO39_08070 [Thermoprotei archaeon]
MKYSADELRCSELLSTRPHSTHPWKSGFSQVMWQAMLGASSLVMLKGLFGSGKTLFIRWAIAEHSFLAASMIPIYLKMRDIGTDLEGLARLAGVELSDVAELIAVAMVYTMRRCHEDKECISEAVLKELKRLLEEVKRYRGKGFTALELLKRLADSSSYGVALLIDELEYIAWLAGTPLGAPLERRYAATLYTLLSDIFENLYQLLHKGEEYIVVLASALDLRDLLLTSVARFLDLRSSGQTLPPRVMESLAKFIETLARYSGVQGLVSLAMGRRVDYGFRALERLRILTRIEPGVYTRLRHNLVELSYLKDDYLEILRVNIPSLDLESGEHRIAVEYFAELAERVGIPPRTLMFMVRRYIDNEAWRETVNAMNTLKGLASKYYGSELVQALEPIEKALRRDSIHERLRALCIDIDELTELDDEVLRRVYEVDKPVYMDSIGRACLVPRLETLTALFEGFKTEVLNPRNPLESIVDTMKKLFTRNPPIT